MAAETETTPLVAVALRVEAPARLLRNFIATLVEDGDIPHDHHSDQPICTEWGVLRVPREALPGIRRAWDCYRRHYPDFTFMEPEIREPQHPLAPLGPDDPDPND